MTFTVKFSRKALADLRAIERYIADKSGERIATRFVDALIDRCEALTYFPQQGSMRDEVAPGVRSIVHRRTVTILYRVHGNEVRIARFFYRGRDWPQIFRH